jgi:flavodoxin
VKTLIVYISYHHGNTEAVARAIGEVLDAELRSPAAVKPNQLAD